MAFMTEPQTFETSERELFAKGAELRSRVLGAKHVARNGGTEIDAATSLQRLMTEIGWGTIWQRGELELKTRSLITVAMLIALNRPHELRTHLQGAVNNGASLGELRELVIHTILYCGFPAAIDGMAVLDELIADLQTEKEK
jgi:4-carboxymuconolactone decarboxylase